VAGFGAESVAEAAPGHEEKTLHRECRVRDCAGTTIRRRVAFRTIALPGTPRVERPGTAVPVQKQAAGARAAWSPPSQFTTPATTLLVRRWDTGTPSASRCPRRPGLRAGRVRARDRGRCSGMVISLVHGFLNPVSSSRFRLGSQKRALRECPSRALLGPDVREGPVRECPQQRRERHVRSTPKPRVVDRTREGCLASALAPYAWACACTAPITYQQVQGP